MADVSIEAFFVNRQQQLTMQAHLYALVDGLLFADTAGGSPPQRSQAAVALFDGTPDASLADAGPWLLDWERASGGVRHALSAMAGGSTGVSWLISAYPIESLADELRRRLDVRLPDGRTALLRFYDARIMADVASLMELTQRMQFFVPTFNWLVEVNGKLKGVHPHA
ncbi:hypothetical protein WK80_14210 [Burkholderia multivorans]|uniref:DUF4123 domain-containing protein n=1 Tax=Burkholderia multivorans TaxID=87883 RepID=UPI00075E0B50|nr:DUF4123 domain-containing protein [Burkholderia multivorans]KVV27670.1 hypothetical protein WK80_14210 [Burkholderia multivorans]MBU9309447.1 DUF4123 domain-containing protein [Burkholderia multivorans]MCO8314690.1 DUF4123 domain-containing protein [Burkholderia multivorans]MCO8425213.1 DUF4123 domain-containing protein [Burkholderia multivorans]MCO8438209.1 DUF4123 domain-containing protein [Burkholderia multivorans]